MSACAYALRKVCEEASAVIYEPSNLEVLLWVGEVSYICNFNGYITNALLIEPKKWK